MQYLLKYLWKNFYCRFFHRNDRCYPQDYTYWHCDKCHPCNEEMDELFKKLEEKSNV